VLNAIRRLGKTEFTTADAYAFTREREKLHPDNKNVRPKIRQQLQVLRNTGLLRHAGKSFEPFSSRHFRLGVEPFGQQAELVGGHVPGYDSVKQMRKQGPGKVAAGRGPAGGLNKVSRHPGSSVCISIFALLSTGPAHCDGANFFLELFATTDGVSAGKWYCCEQKCAS
jgi:hypothetical protein